MPAKKKKHSLLVRLGQKLKTPKGRLIAIMLVFAVIGGGIFVYKSFAATASWTYTLDNGYMVANGSSGGCKTVKVRDPSFYNSTVANMTCSSTGSSTISTRGAAGADNQTYRVCAWAKGVGRLWFHLYTPDTTDRTQQVYSVKTVSSLDRYTYYCSDWTTVRGYYGGQVVGLTTHVSVGDKGTFLNVGALVIDKW